MRYGCPSCSGAVTLHAGERKARHFHHRRSACSVETVLHVSAKRLIVQAVEAWKAGGPAPVFVRACAEPGCGARARADPAPRPVSALAVRGARRAPRRGEARGAVRAPDAQRARARASVPARGLFRVRAGGRRTRSTRRRARRCAACSRSGTGGRARAFAAAQSSRRGRGDDERGHAGCAFERRAGSPRTPPRARVRAASDRRQRREIVSRRGTPSRRARSPRGARGGPPRGPRARAGDRCGSPRVLGAGEVAEHAVREPDALGAKRLEGREVGHRAASAAICWW